MNNAKRVKNSLVKFGDTSYTKVEIGHQQYGDRFRVVNYEQGRCQVSEIGGGLFFETNWPEQASRVFWALEAHDKIPARAFNTPFSNRTC